MRTWPIFERKRSLTFFSCFERKIHGKRALAIRQSEKRFKGLGNIRMDLVKKMVTGPSVGGLVDQDCTAFLSDKSEDEQVELGINSQRHLAIVVPLSALKSRDISDITECNYHFTSLFDMGNECSKLTKFKASVSSIMSWLIYFIHLILINHLFTIIIISSPLSHPHHIVA